MTLSVFTRRTSGNIGHLHECEPVITPHSSNLPLFTVTQNPSATVQGLKIDKILSVSLPWNERSSEYFPHVPYDRRIYRNMIMLSERLCSQVHCTLRPQKPFLYTNTSLVLLIQLGFVAFNNVSSSLSCPFSGWLFWPGWKWLGLESRFFYSFSTSKERVEGLNKASSHYCALFASQIL